jgi:20S proteasome alpha/beta subunit
MIARLIHGFDFGLRQSILNSGKWTGTQQELDEILFQQFLAHPTLPVREAIDFVHSCIYSTIKALKFSNFSQICGGPIEIGVITTDRKFRWVRHKRWDAAIAEGDRQPGEIQ